MQPLQIELPRSVLVATGQDQEAFVLEAKLILATHLFETGQLSSGQAAEGCELTRGQFLLEASRRGAPVIDLDREEMLREFADD